MKRMHSLYNLLSKHYTNFALIPIFLIEVVLLVLYFSINHYISQVNITQLEKDSYNYSTNLLRRETDRIDLVLSEISRSAALMQKNHQNIMKSSDVRFPGTRPQFAKAPNGVFYKTNLEGGSVYYSSHTLITDIELQKAEKTEAMDPLLMSLVDLNPNIVAAYFNSYDDMNRLYPFIDKVYEQYGEHIHMEDYNFYYLADKEHNPEKTPVWTSAYLDPAGNGWMMSCIVPVYNKDFLEGVSGLDITIDSFVKNILTVSLPYKAEMFMVDQDGTILAMPEKVEKLLGLNELKSHVYSNAITNTVTKPEEFNILKNDTPFAAHFRDMFQQNLDSTEMHVEGSSYLTIQQVVKETGWHLMILMDKSEILAYVNSYKSLSDKLGYFAIAFMSLFYIVFFYIFTVKSRKVAREITDPVDELTDYTSQLINNDFQPREIQSNVHELQLLSSNFSKMAVELKAHKTDLEGLVDERTRQLQESKAKYITLYEQAEATNKKLKEAQMTIIHQEKMASIGQLAAGVAHELNNPIGFIVSNFKTLQNYLERLHVYYKFVAESMIKMTENQPDNSIQETSELSRLKNELKIDFIEEDIKNLFDESDEGFERVISIVNNLRSFSRIDIINERHMYDVNEGLQNTLVVAKSKIKYVADVQTDYGKLDKVIANGGAVNQVFLNVLVNAAEAIKEQQKAEKGLITIKTEQKESWIYCHISDNGPGIADEHLSRIFDPFYTTKDPGQGTGLGLNISYDIIVNMHKGKLDVTTSPEGTTFIIAIPLATDEHGNEGSGQEQM